MANIHGELSKRGVLHSKCHEVAFRPSHWPGPGRHKRELGRSRGPGSHCPRDSSRGTPLQPPCHWKPGSGSSKCTKAAPRSRAATLHPFLVLRMSGMAEQIVRGVPPQNGTESTREIGSFSVLSAGEPWSQGWPRLDCRKREHLAEASQKDFAGGISRSYPIQMRCPLQANLKTSIVRPIAFLRLVAPFRLGCGFDLLRSVCFA